MSDPLYVELDDESLRDQFNDLLEAMGGVTTFDPNREEGAYDTLNQRIYEAITNKPVLAKIFNGSNQSLLSSACANLNLESSHRVIKCLIQAYPRALLGPPTYYINDDQYTNIPIFMIARHPQHCLIMPWIASNHTWIFDNDRCQELPPVFDFLRMYVQRHRTSCTSITLRQFLEAYPRAFTQQHPIGGNILLNLLKNNNECKCEADLFKWMADRCHSSIFLETNSQGYTLLHLACVLLFNRKGTDSSEICKYLVQKCPGSVRRTNMFDYLPIHLLHDGCGYWAVREVVVCLLREYPESYDMQSPSHLTGLPPSSVPFIQNIKPYLDEEKELKVTVESLMNSTSSLTKAVSCTNDQLIRSSSTVYDSWANSFINSAEDKVKLISTQLQDMCNEGLEPDE